VICCVVVVLYVLINEIAALCLLVIIYCVGLVFDVSKLVTRVICYVSLVFNYCVLIFLELLNSLIAYFVIPFSV